MKKWCLPIILLVPFLFCCKQKPVFKYYYLSYGGGSYQWADTLFISGIEKKRAGDTLKLEYDLQRDTLDYRLLKKEADHSFFTTSSGHLKPMRLFSDTVVTVNHVSYAVSKYLMDEEIIDGSSFHYYCPQLGIFAMHSGTWPGIILLQTSDSNVNRTIIELAKSTVPSFFIRGKLADDF